MTKVHDSKPVTVGELRAALADRASFRKNGHTWGEYLSKWVTPQNIVIVGLAVFSVGGRVQEVQTGVSAAITASKAAMAATEAQEKFARQLSERAQLLTEQMESIRQRQDQYATKSDVDAVKELLKLAVTRREFRESIDAQQQILHRLDRIDASVKDQR